MVRKIYIRNRSGSGAHVVDVFDDTTDNFASYEHRYLSVAKGVAKFVFQEYPRLEPTNDYNEIMSRHHRGSDGMSQAEREASERRKAIQAEEDRLMRRLYDRRLSIKRYHKETPQERSTRLTWWVIWGVVLLVLVYQA